MTGSPSFSNSREDLAQRGSTGEVPTGVRGLIVTPRPDSRDRASQISGYSLSTNNRATVASTMSSDLTSDYYNESGNTPWTPQSNTFKDHVNSRPASSAYTNSSHEAHIPSRGNKSPGFFPSSGTPYRPPTKSKMSLTTSDTSNPNHNSISARAQEEGIAAAGLTGLPVTHGKGTRAADGRDSTVTHGVSSYYADPNVVKENEVWQTQPSNPKPTTSSDMSWVNLTFGGGQRRT